MPQISLFDKEGNRKYLTPAERLSFAEAAKKLNGRKRTFCLMLLHTGCRISEALALTHKHIDYGEKGVIFRTLKQHKEEPVYRSVPLSEQFMDELNLVHDLKKNQKSKKYKDQPIWGWKRKYGYLVIMEAMQLAGLSGIHACSKGLRHAFAIACLDKQIQLNMVQKWLGHSSPATTAIYANAVGQEERNIAARLWE